MKFMPWQKERLEELVALWNQELQERFPMRFELFQQNSFLDKNISYEGSRMVVNENDKVVGFIVAKHFKENTPVKLGDGVGWIQTILVDSNYRNQGIGTQLLQHAESILQQKGVKEILLGRDTYHYFPGVPSEEKETARWFEKRGYLHLTTETDLSRSYEVQEPIEWPVIPNVEFSILQEAEKKEFLAFLHRCFPGRWEYEAVHYFQKGGTGREFVVLKENDVIIGFCRVNDVHSPIIMGNINWSPLFNESYGGIGPLGVDAEKRKNGYGLAVVKAGIATLRERGITRIVIDWTGLVDFYRKLGFESWKSYEGYKKEL